MKNKPRGKHVALSESERERIKELAIKGHSNTQIGNLVKRSRGTVSKVRSGKFIEMKSNFFNWNTFKVYE